MRDSRPAVGAEEIKITEGPQGPQFRREKCLCKLYNLLQLKICQPTMVSPEGGSIVATLKYDLFEA